MTHGNTTHGKSHTQVYKHWMQIILRCRNPSNPAYKYYGGRGIKVCDRWKTFDNFHADMGERPQNCVIDRINNEGDYAPSNCRWVDLKTSSRNKRCVLKITIGNDSKTIKEWCDVFGVKYITAKKRIDSGWIPSVAVTTPAKNDI